MIGLPTRGFAAVDLAIIVAHRGSADAMTDTTTQLAILSDALGQNHRPWSVGGFWESGAADLLSRAGDIAAQALTAAATYGRCRHSRILNQPKITARERRRSQTRCFGEIDPEPIAFPLVSPRHFGGGVTEMFLHMRFLDLR